MSTTSASRAAGRPPWLLPLVAAVVLALLAASALAWWLDRKRDEEWAHGGDDIDITAQIQATSPQDYPDALEAAGVRREPAYPRVSQMYVVQVSWSGAPSGGFDAFVLLDGRLSPPKPLGASGSWGAEGRGGGGSHWNGSYEALSEHYPWLAGTASVRNADGSYSMDYEALSLHSAGDGGGVLSFYLPKPGIATSDPEHDLVLAMVHTDDDGDVRWARKVPFT